MESRETAKITAERWKRIKDVFQAALELPTESRSEFLTVACHGDDTVRGEVKRLLQERDRMGDSAERWSNGTTLACLLDVHTFVAGELVSERFRIVRFIGRGGMGEVYEAEDLALGVNIALKTIRPEIAADERVIARFKREIQLSRRVTHDNVCRIFDLERHEPKSGVRGPTEEVTYLTMELLSGETLAERLRRTGRMTTAEALPIVAQIIDGLQAAHRVQIVHGDLKSSNVLLVPSSAGTVRAVITDFGLARLSAPDGEPAGPTGGTGTPAYMAPEQVKHGTITTAADIYSLGVVIFEMVTGTLPFVADTPTLIAKKRLEQDPPAPGSIVSDLDCRWEAAILRCLERDPAYRFASVADVAWSLQCTRLLPVHIPRRRSMLVASLALLVLASSVAGYRGYLMSRPANKVRLAQSKIREALAHEQKAESKKAETAFAEAQHLYAAAGDRGGIAEALTDMGDLLRDQSEFVRATSAYRSALAIDREIGSQQGVAALDIDIGNVLFAQDDLRAARSRYESALTISRKIDDKRHIGIALKEMGNVAPSLAEGQKDYEQALTVFKEIGYKAGAARTLDDLGVVLDDQGYLSAARRAFEEEISMWHEIGGQQHVRYLGGATGNLGDVLYEQGNLSAADADFEESLRIDRTFNRPMIPWAVCQLGELRLQQAQLGDARQFFEEALALGYKWGNREDVASARLLLARLALEENRPAEAESEARQAVEQFGAQSVPTTSPQALAVLARALAAQRKFHDARHVLTVQLPLAIKEAPPYSYGDELFVRVTVARALVATGNMAEGTKRLQSALVDASRLGYLSCQLEVRLALDKLLCRSGHDKAKLQELRAEASAKGFQLIAKKADDTLAGVPPLP